MYVPDLKVRHAARADRTRSARAFTLVELLVVIGIIGLLIGIITPVVSRLRDEAKLAHCQHNLRQIGVALLAYANDHRGMYPDAIAVGNFAYRLEPGRKTLGDPAALPETYGMAAVLHGIRPQQSLFPTYPPAKYLDARGGVWACPAAADNIAPYGNTYAFFTRTWRTRDSSGGPMVWDNDTLFPGLSGFRGPFSGYNIPTADRRYSHRGIGSREKGAIVELIMGQSTRVRMKD